MKAETEFEKANCFKSWETVTSLRERFGGDGLIADLLSPDLI